MRLAAFVLALVACDGRVSSEGVDSGYITRKTDDGIFTYPSCATSTPLNETFESPMLADWGSVNAGALRANTASPLDGATSLDVDLGSGSAYYANTIAPSCFMRVRLAVRMPTLFTTETAEVLRLDTGTTALSIVIGAAGAVSLVETNASGPPVGHPIGTLSANLATRIEVMIDLQDGWLGGGVDPLSANSSREGPHAAVALANGQGITSVQLGLRATTAPRGIITLDDFSLD